MEYFTHAQIENRIKEVCKGEDLTKLLLVQTDEGDRDKILKKAKEVAKTELKKAAGAPPPTTGRSKKVYPDSLPEGKKI